MGRGWVETKNPPPPYFGVEKFKKRGIRVIRDSGRAQFQDLGPDLGANLAVIIGPKICKVGSKSGTLGSRCPFPCP